jgi:hypothetical protein
MNRKELEMRTKNLHPDYEMREAPEYGIGLWPVHRKTGEVCDCSMEWNDDGTTLSCPVCGLDGT